MTKETKALAEKINTLKNKQVKKEEVSTKRPSGYQIVTEVVIDLLGCILMGASLGIIFQNMFDTSARLTVALTLLGGIAGIWSVIKYAISLEKKEDTL
ncbi:MAG: AtpZ/AtpI family protein [Alphaproteobacteria bacterium]|nr:AtpZ/AtpI family protein [Alphaproteobacteria bacterium]